MVNKIGKPLTVIKITKINNELAFYIYNEKTNAEAIFEAKANVIASGRSVCAMRDVPKKIRYKEIVYLNKEDAGND